MVEYIQGISVIRAFNLQGERFEQFEGAMDRYRNRAVGSWAVQMPLLKSACYPALPSGRNARKRFRYWSLVNLVYSLPGHRLRRELSRTIHADFRR